MPVLIDAACGVEYKVVIAGSGPMEKKLKKQVKKLGLKKCNFFGISERRG